MDTITTLNVSPLPGTLTVNSIAPTDITRIFEEPASYTISLSSTVAIETNDKLVIAFPNTFTVVTGNCVVTGLNIGYSCLS